MLQLYSKLIKLSDMTLVPLLNLAIRLYMANIFFLAGKLKWDSFINDNWQEQVEAFTDYHPVPGVDPEVAAYMAMGGELILPALLAVGLLTRFSAAGLIVMTLVIQFGVPEEFGLRNDDHYLWMLLLAVPMLKGGNILSIDGLAQRFLFNRKKSDTTRDDQNIGAADVISTPA